MGIVADVQTYLQSMSPDIIDGSTGWPSAQRRVHDGSNQLVVITEDGGFEPETPAPSGSMGDAAHREPAVQIRVRGEPTDGGAVTEAKAAEIWNALHGLLQTQLGSTYYMRVKAQTEPIFIGFDDKGRPEITMSFRAVRSVTA